MNNNMAGLFEDIIGETPKDVNKFVNKAMDIADQIVDILKAKNLTQRKLAELLGKRESEISKWLAGTHNFTLETISKIEAVLDEDIIIAPLYMNEYKGMYQPKPNSFTVESNPDNHNLRDYQFQYSYYNDYEKPTMAIAPSTKLNFEEFTNKKLDSFKGQKITSQNCLTFENTSETGIAPMSQCI